MPHSSKYPILLNSSIVHDSNRCMNMSRAVEWCWRSRYVPKVRLCTALPKSTDQATWRWHVKPARRQLANRLNHLVIPQLVASSQFFFLWVIQRSAALTFSVLANVMWARGFAGRFSAKLDVTIVPHVQCQRQCDGEIPRLLHQTLVLRVLEQEAVP